LGDRFLGHAERCSVILHLVDGTQSGIVDAYRTIRGELQMYGHGLAEKPEILVLNKTDAIEKSALSRKRAALAKACGGEVLTMSGVSGDGVQDVLRALANAVTGNRKHGTRIIPAWSP
jgi:GTP-binding protein